MRNPYEVARKLLDLVTEGFQTAGVQLPDVTYVAPGSTVAFDGPQITVHLTGLELGNPSISRNRHEQLPGAEVWFARLLITIIRDTPGLGDNGEIPDQQDLEKSAKENMLDTQTLTEVLLTIRRNCRPNAGGLVDSQMLMDHSNVSPVGPEGGVAAVTALVEVSLL